MKLQLMFIKRYNCLFNASKSISLFVYSEVITIHVLLVNHQTWWIFVRLFLDCFSAWLSVSLCRKFRCQAGSSLIFTIETSVVSVFSFTPGERAFPKMNQHLVRS